MDSRNQPHNNSTAMNLSSISNEIILGAAENWQSGQMQPGMSGNLDDFKLYNKSLTDTEIRKEYQIDTGTIAPTITQTTVNNQNTLEAFNRDRFKELEYISPLSELERIYNIVTGITPPEPFTPSMPEDNPDQISTLLTPTLNTTPTPTNTNQTLISPETLSLLNPLNYPFTTISPTEISVQISGVEYIVNLNNYLEFYLDLENNNINTLAKYLNKISNLSEEISYTKYYPSSLYEYDSRGYITINVPFNGKVVFTQKYSLENNLVENSYLVNNYLATPVLILDTNASTTNVINSDAWGNIINNQINTNSQTKTSFGLTGHKLSENHDLVYAHARFLNSNSKHWLSNDPMSITGFSSDYFLLNPQFQNSYSYSGNNPVNNVDPDGKAVEIISRQLNVDVPLVGSAFKLATHSFIKITPDDPDTFKGTMYRGNDGKLFFTISIDTDGYPYGNMTLVRNLPNDVSTAKNGYVKENDKVVLRQKDKIKVYPGNQTPDELAKKILKEVDAYGQDGLYSIYSTDGMNCNKMSYTLSVLAGGTPQWNKLSGVGWGFGSVQDMSNYPKSSSAKQKEQMYMMGIVNVQGSPNSLILSKPTK